MNAPSAGASPPGWLPGQHTRTSSRASGLLSSRLRALGLGESTGLDPRPRPLLTESVAQAGSLPHPGPSAEWGQLPHRVVGGLTGADWEAEGGS